MAAAASDAKPVAKMGQAELSAKVNKRRKEKAEDAKNNSSASSSSSSTATVISDDDENNKENAPAASTGKRGRGRKSSQPVCLYKHTQRFCKFDIHCVYR
jgi:hypothetical protein